MDLKGQEIYVQPPWYEGGKLIHGCLNRLIVKVLEVVSMDDSRCVIKAEVMSVARCHSCETAGLDHYTAAEMEGQTLTFSGKIFERKRLLTVGEHFHDSRLTLKEVSD